MIGILLNDSAYEQDIRELLMAFYPGQTFAHEMQEDLDFFVEGTVNEDRTEFTLCLGYFGSSCFHLLSMEKLEPEIRAEFQAAAENSVLKVNYENRFETKNKIKRRLYVLLMQQTGKQLPWGTLTGIRPTKIAMTKLAEGDTPEQVFRYPQPYTSIPLWDASMVPVSSAIEDTLRSGGMLNIGSLALGLGEYAAPMGTGAALVILACGLFLWTQKDAHMSASISFLVTCAVIAFFFPRQAGLADSAVLSNILPRLQCVRDELLTGAILFSAVFLINEPYTCVHHRMGRVLYGVLVGVVSMGFRYYGVYETGVCFALLAVNSVSAWIDRTEAKLYHLTHLQADAGKGAAQ